MRCALMCVSFLNLKSNPNRFNWISLSLQTPSLWLCTLAHLIALSQLWINIHLIIVRHFRLPYYKLIYEHEHEKHFLRFAFGFDRFQKHVVFPHSSDVRLRMWMERARALSINLFGGFSDAKHRLTLRAISPIRICEILWMKYMCINWMHNLH